MEQQLGLQLLRAEEQQHAEARDHAAHQHGVDALDELLRAERNRQADRRGEERRAERRREAAAAGRRRGREQLEHQRAALQEVCAASGCEGEGESVGRAW